MRRFASIDFLRGLAIFLMLFLHSVMIVFDFGALDTIDQAPLINIVALLVLPFMGGLAGFFLLVSAIGNMISMQRHLQAGKSVKDLAIRQIMGGALLLLFAVLTEAWIGYHGALGEALHHLDGSSFDGWNIIYYRGHHMETIHTIAWCIILNGIVQAVLSRNDAYKDPDRVIKIYVILAIVVVALTLPVWLLAQQIVPGYPYGTYADLGVSTSTRSVQYPLQGVTTLYEYIGLFFLTAFAGHPEPVFPYLAISFVGSIIGIQLARPREKVPREFPLKMMKIGFVMFWVGVIGTIISLVAVMNVYGFDQMLNSYQRIWDHRAWTPDGPAKTWWFGWLFQFLALNGAGICMSLLIVRLVDFRGRAKPFAEKTAFIRRFGFVAFSVYNYQFVIYLMQLLVSVLLPGLITNSTDEGFRPLYGYFGWPGTFLVMVLSIGAMHLILRLWEKVKYTGSLEWCIGTMAAALIPARKVAEGEKKPKWWQVGQLDVKNAFYEAEWLNVIEEDEIRHDEQKESKLAWKLSLAGALCFVPLLGICLLPIAFLAFRIATNSVEKEQENTFNKRAKILSIVEMVVGVVWIALGFAVSLAGLGVSL